MTEPLKPISKAAQATYPTAGEKSSSQNPELTLPDWELQSQSVYLKDQTSPFVGADSFVSGEEVLAASLALFEPETSQREEGKMSPAQKTLELDRLDYLLGLSTTRVNSKNEGASAELQKQRDEFTALYAAHASEQARLEREKKKRKFWRKVSEFLKSVFLKD